MINNQTRAPITNQGTLKINDFLKGLWQSIMAINNIEKV